MRINEVFSNENYYKNVKKNPVVIPSYYALVCYIVTIFMLMAICNCLVPNVSAYTAGDEQQTSVSVHSLESTYQVAPSAYSSHNSVNFAVNFSTIGTPSNIAFFNTGTKYPAQSGIFNITHGGKIIAYGTYQYANGSFVNGTTKYTLLNFDYWNNQGYSTCQVIQTINFTPDLADSKIDAGSGMNTALGEDCGKADARFVDYYVKNYALSGETAIIKRINVLNIIDFIALSDESESSLFNLHIQKAGDPTIVRIYKNNGVPLYLGNLDLFEQNLTFIGAPFYSSVYVPSNDKFYNSSLLYILSSMVTPTVTPTATPTLAPTPTSANQAGYGYYTSPINIIDAVSDGLIPNAQVSIYNTVSGNWSNKTTTTGYINYNHNGGMHDICAVATGYEDNCISKYLGADTVVNLLLVPQIGGATGTDNKILKVITYDYTTDLPLANSMIVVKNTTAFSTKSGYTNSAGYAEIVIPTSESCIYFSLSASNAPNYYSVSQNTMMCSASNTAELYLSRKTAVSTPTYTATPVTTAIKPIVTPSTWTNESAAKCSDLNNSTTLVNWAKSNMACNGFETAQSQSLAIAALIIIFFLMCGAIYGKALGGAIGAIIGFVLAFAAGLIPFVVLALLFVILILLAVILLGSKFIGTGG